MTLRADVARLGPVEQAVEFDLPACGRCGADRGDPCRTRKGRTTRPHKIRIPLILFEDQRDANSVRGAGALNII